MRIAHVCLSCFYIDGYAYQENELVRRHVQDGHDVTVIASTENYGLDRRLTYVEPSSYMGGDGALVIRVPYSRWLPQKIMRKLRLHPGVFTLLKQIQPDLIVFHGLCGWELNAVAKYKKLNPVTLLYVDSHEDQNNSARGFISRFILHKIYYAAVIKACISYFDKVLCVSLETMDFVSDTYGIPRSKLEFFPLGGRVFDEEEYKRRRISGRERAGVSAEDVLILQSGKMGARKKVLESLQAFVATPGVGLRFVLAGSIEDSLRNDVNMLIASDSRIIYLGWQSSEELTDLLCAADVYVQPGSQSATMQMALCCRCPVILDDVPSHVPYIDGNGWAVRDRNGLADAFKEIAANPNKLCSMSKRSFGIASSLLDYRMLAKRLLK